MTPFVIRSRRCPIFTSRTEVYRQRVIQLGENRYGLECWRFGVDVAVHAQLMEKGDLEEALGLLGDKSLAITFHPETGSLTTA